jgi:hypothetical protein
MSTATVIAPISIYIHNIYTTYKHIYIYKVLVVALELGAEFGAKLGKEPGVLPSLVSLWFSPHDLLLKKKSYIYIYLYIVSNYIF